jgi:pimeloyl-ACP methyl ester carboxylesterase
MRFPRGARLVVVASMLLGGLSSTAPVLAETGIVDLPLTFTVVNRNTSKLACPGFDGQQYVVRGSLVAPASVLTASERAVTLYLHGSTVGEFQWHFREFRSRGYDFAWEMAERGHASVTIDQLGYGSSDHPHGHDMCTGTLADVAHQVVQALRHGGAVDVGGYELDGGPGIAFGRLALAGNSWGTLVAQIEVYSFHDVDALIEHGMNNQPVTVVHSFPFLAPQALSCAQGGDGGSGYAYSWADPEMERYSAFWDIEADVWQAVKQRLYPDPCGNVDSNGDAIFGPDQQLLVGEIDVPVLIVAGEFDAMVGPTRISSEIQGARMTSSPDVTVRTIANQGHVGQFEVTKDALFEVIEEWLRDRSF